MRLVWLGLVILISSGDRYSPLRADYKMRRKQVEKKKKPRADGRADVVGKEKKNVSV